MKKQSFWHVPSMDRIGVILRRSAALVGMTLLILVGFLYGTMWICVNGPSSEARRLFVLSVRETSAAKFLANWFVSQEEIDRLEGKGGSAMGEETMDTSLIRPQDTTSPSSDSSSNGGTTDPPVRRPSDGIHIETVKGGTYTGVMMIVDDPSRVFVGTLDAYGSNAQGITLEKMMEKYGAYAGINAGGFIDVGGRGNGGTPDGLVMSGGSILWGDTETFYNCVVGFDATGILYVGNMTGQRALDLKLQSAVSFGPGPVLIQNGVAANSRGSLGGGLNPRTAIGQRSDGAILLLTVNGRQVGSLGATYDDLVDIMLSYGAVNAANLDGGSSSLMVCDGKVLNSSSSLVGDRRLPDAILVRP